MVIQNSYLAPLRPKLFHHNLLNFCLNQLQTFVAASCRLIAFCTGSSPACSQISLCRYRTSCETQPLLSSHSSCGPLIEKLSMFCRRRENAEGEVSDTLILSPQSCNILQALVCMARAATQDASVSVSVSVSHPAAQHRVPSFCYKQKLSKQAYTYADTDTRPTGGTCTPQIPYLIDALKRNCCYLSWRRKTRKSVDFAKGQCSWFWERRKVIVLQ